MHGQCPISTARDRVRGFQISVSQAIVRGSFPKAISVFHFNNKIEDFNCVWYLRVQGDGLPENL